MTPWSTLQARGYTPDKVVPLALHVDYWDYIGWKDPYAKEDAAVYLAAFENKLASQVGAGENKGKTLPHDYVVREWVGPIRFGPGLRVAEKRTLALLPDADPRHSGVAAFVQNRSSGDVLQALMLPACGA